MPIIQVYLLVSFLRGMIATLIGSVLELVSEEVAPFVILLPILFYLLFLKLKKPKLMIIINPIVWMVTILIPSMYVKFLFTCIGIAISLVNIHRTKPDKSLLPFFIPIDLLLRHINFGQEPLFHFNSIWLLIIYIFIGIGFIFISASEFNNQEINRDQTPMILYFQLLLIYILFIANSGVITTTRGTNGLLSSYILMIVYIVPFLILYTKPPNSTIFFFGLSIVLLLSIYFYPWPGFSIILLPVGILSMLILFQSKHKQRELIILGYVGFISVIYFLLTTENQFVTMIPLIPLLIKFRNPGLKMAKIKPNKFLSILVVLLLIFPMFVSYNGNINASHEIRVLDYNIHFGLNNSGRDNTQSLISFIETQKPTIITLQEVVTNSPLNGFGNVYGKLLLALGKMGYTYSYLSEGGSYSTRNAIFSVFPILNSQTFTIEPVTEYQRSFILTELEIDHGNTIMVGTTHLTNVGTSKGTINRLEQVKDLLTELDLSKNLILSGDFNSIPSSNEYLEITDIIQDAWVSNWTYGVNRDDGLTSPSDEPNKRIDYIFINGFTVKSCSVEHVLISDHLPLICNIEQL